METNPFDQKDKIKVLLAQPSAGVVDCIAVDNRLDSYIEFGRLEATSNFKFFTGNVGRSLISYAREMMADQAIKLGMDYIFMVDDDMILPKRCFQRVFDTLIAEKADLAAPICTQRIPPYHPVLYKHSYEKRPDGATNFKNDFISDYSPNSTITVDGIGFGVVLISVPFLKKMKEIMPQGMFFSNSNVGEDIWFCHKARTMLDAKIVVNTSVKVGHLKHPEMVGEWDYINATGQQDKFKEVYGFSSKPSMIYQEAE